MSRPVLCGVLVVDKPAGRTSFAVVRDVRRMLRVKKVGHAGTLDPMATGVLPVCVGEATKVATFLLHSDKRYDAEITFGTATDTDDAEGEIIERQDVPPLDSAAVGAAVEKFLGPGRQRPPAYSAIKVKGRRAYDLARKGESVELAERDVIVHEARCTAVADGVARVSLRVSKGFYVRSFARDLGTALSTCAHLSALRRTASGPFVIDQSVTLEALEARLDAGEALPFISPADALVQLPAYQLGPAEAAAVRNGRRPRSGDIPVTAHPASGWIRLLDERGLLAAVVRRDPSHSDEAPLELARVFTGV